MNHLARPPLHIELELARAVEADRPHGVAAGRWTRYLLRNPDDSGCYEDGQFLWDDSVQADLAATSDAAAAGEAVARLAKAMRRFIDSAGWAPIAARIRDARAAGRAVCLTVRSVAHEIYTLPWELLELDGIALCESDDCLLRYQRAEPAHAPPGTPPGTGERVLVAWSGGVPASEHIDAVAAAARAGNVRFDRARDVLAHASLASLGAALRAQPVTILHLLCHGQVLPDGRAHGLVLDGADEPVPPDELRKLLAPHCHSLRLVVLSACLGSSAGALDNERGSVAQAVLAAGVSAVVAARYPLSTAGSVLLARTLYQRLFVDLWPLERAFLAARAALRDQTPGPPRSLDLVALQLHVHPTQSLDFRPWIIRPYRGLSVYDREDGRLFFGRDEERTVLLGRMAGMIAGGTPRFLLVAGASGTGKSSLVRAGLLGALEQGRMSGGAPWTTAVLRPGEGHAPLDRLTRCLEQHRAAPARTRLALVVDQLEELFTEISEPAQREAFLRALWRLACEPGGDVFVLATIRIDYLGHLGTVRVDDAGATFDRELLDGERYYLIRQLGPAQYERIIRGPAEAAGALVEPGLLEHLLDKLRTEPGALPLLSYTLDQLWQQRGFATQEIDWSYVTGRHDAGARAEKALVTGWWLTDVAYSGLGGIGGALASSADALHAELGPAHQAELRRVLVQLIHDHDDPMLATRRRGWLQALRPGDESARVYDEVIDELVEARLLVRGSAGGPDDPVWIELAHDAFIRSWPQLRQWYQEARAWLAHADELRQMAESWRRYAGEGDARAGERTSLILSGQLLSFHLEAWGRYHEQLGVQEQRLGRAFLAACVRAERERIEAERAREHAARRRTRLTALVAVLVAVVMSTLGLLALDQQLEAEKQRKDADTQRAQAETQRALAVEREILARDALLMASARELVNRNLHSWATRLLEEVSQPMDVQAWRVLALEALSHAWLISTLRGHEGPVDHVAFSPGGQLVVTASQDGTARIWREDGTDAPLVLRHDAAVQMVDISPDGQLVATASRDGTARIWRVDGSGAPLVLRHDGEVHAVDFSQDGQLVVTGSEDRTARLWRVHDGAQVEVLRAHTRGVRIAMFSPDGEHVLTGAFIDPPALWRLDDLRQPTILGGSAALVFWADFSPDGKIVVTGGDGTPHLWWIHAPTSPVRLARHKGAVISGAFDPAGGRQILTASNDNTVRLWKLDGPDRTDPLDAHEVDARFAAFSPDGQRFVTTFDDGTVHLGYVEATTPVYAALTGHEALVSSAAFSPDGKRLATASADGSVRIWHAEVPDLFFSTLYAEHRVKSASFGASGDLVLIVSGAQNAQVWRADGSARLAVIGGEAHPVEAAALSPDGERVATISSDGRLTLWRVRDASQIATVPAKVLDDPALQFSPDGKLLLTVAGDRTAQLWRGDDLTLAAFSPPHAHDISAVAFSADGKRVITATQRGVAYIWDVTDFSQLAILDGHDGDISSAAFSPDGRLVMINAFAETCVWSIADLAQPRVLQRYPSSDADAVFSPDGTQILTSSKGKVQVRNVHEPAQAITLSGQRGRIYEASFSPDGTLVLTTADEGETRIWSLATPDQPAVLAGLPWLHNASAFSPDGTRVLVTRLDHTVRIVPIDVEGLKSSLRRASTDCLTTAMRQRYMGETRDAARRGYEACERGYGREPRPDRTSRP